MTIDHFDQKPIDHSAWCISTGGPAPRRVGSPASAAHLATLLDLARAMRDGIGEANPSTPGAHPFGDHVVSVERERFMGPLIRFDRGPTEIGTLRLEDAPEGGIPTEPSALHAFLRSTATWLAAMTQAAIDRPTPVGDDGADDPRISLLSRVGMLAAALSGNPSRSIFVSAPSPWSAFRMHDLLGRDVDVHPDAATAAARLVPVCGNLHDQLPDDDPRFSIVVQDLQWSIPSYDPVEAMRVAAELGR